MKLYYLHQLYSLRLSLYSKPCLSRTTSGAAQLFSFALLSHIFVLFSEIYPDIPALSIIVDLTTYWYSYNISYADTEFARLLTPISNFIRKKFIERYRWVLRLSIAAATLGFMVRIVACYQHFQLLDWIAAVKYSNVE